ncbi:hypothetical protein [Sandaracinus amylolyticus]|uniref:hypothetical protein n=1 Tax=Sandaracinus amylolyticus TaxID=927083 RepID=UPI001F2F2A5B|nr:hypothetical protein [Sandaracinus amylolyticus]UJR86963.1 Hypothetical protein I5071_90640 [Sandaracinus amylolyticus]
MWYFAIPKEASASLSGLHARLARHPLPAELRVELDRNAREAHDGGSAGALLVHGPAYRLVIVERTKRGTGGENAGFLASCGQRRPAAGAYPRRWEMYERDPDDAHGNVFAWALDCIRDEAPEGIGFDPRSNVLLGSR